MIASHFYTPFLRKMYVQTLSVLIQIRNQLFTWELVVFIKILLDVVVVLKNNKKISDLRSCAKIQ